MVPARAGGGGDKPSAERRRLSDITNTTLSNTGDSENHLPDSQKRNSVQLHKDIAKLKDMLERKEEIIDSQKKELDKLWVNYCNKSRQNEEIIYRNGQLYKDLMEARDKLKILQHEHSQMASIYKFTKNELEMKLKDALEQLNSLKENQGSCQNKASIPNIITKLAESRARRIQNGYENTTESILTSSGMQGESMDEDSTSSRSGLRRRSSITYKEPSLKMKLRKEQPDVSSLPASKPCNNHARKQSGADELDRVAEEEQMSLHACDSTGLTVSRTDIDISSTSLADLTQAPDLDTNSDAEVEAGLKSKQLHCTPVLNTTNSVHISSASPADLSRAPELDSNYSAEAETGLKNKQLQCTPVPNTAGTVHFSRRISSGRPTRKAAESIGTYKEPPVNIKMRRSE